MKCYVVDTLSGVFALDDSGNAISFLDFNDNEQEILDFYKLLENEKLKEEVKKFFQELKNSGFHEFIFDNAKLKVLVTQELDYVQVIHQRGWIQWCALTS